MLVLLLSLPPLVALVCVLSSAWVQHHGREVLLLRTPDALRFGQIYRAVQRAVEQQGDHR